MSTFLIRSGRINNQRGNTKGNTLSFIFGASAVDPSAWVAEVKVGSDISSTEKVILVDGIY